MTFKRLVDFVMYRQVPVKHILGCVFVLVLGASAVIFQAYLEPLQYEEVPLKSMAVSPNVSAPQSKHVSDESQLKNVAALSTASVASPIWVHVAGAVKHPGAYAVSANARVMDAIQKAGGVTEKANLDAVNLVASLQDGQKVEVAWQFEHKVTNASRSNSASASTLVHLNTASLDLLSTLPGIGQKTAEEILNYRQQKGHFQKIEDLKNVKGIGDKTLEKLRPYLAL